MRDGDPGQQERLGHVETKRGLEAAFAGAEDGARQPPAGVVDEDVQMAELADGTRDQGLELLGHGDVGGHAQGPSPARLDLPGRLFEVRRGPRGHDDIGPCFGERDRRALADALARAGDQGHPAVEAKAVEDAHLETSTRCVRAAVYSRRPR